MESWCLWREPKAMLHTYIEHAGIKKDANAIKKKLMVFVA